MAAYLIFSGAFGSFEVPWPDDDAGLYETETTVSGGFSIKNVFVGQKLGRSRVKIPLKWHRLDNVTWSRIMNIYENSFVVSCRFWDDRTMSFRTRKFYFGNISRRPGKVDKETGAWLYVRDCAVNIIDAGGGS